MRSVVFINNRLMHKLIIFLSLLTASQPIFAKNTPGGPESVSASRFQTIDSTKGMVVSDDRQASEWGAEILRQGGNAVDAAVATAFALAVTRPHYAAIGGGGFMIYCPHPTGTSGPPACTAINYREQAPGKASRDMYLKGGKDGIVQPHLSQNGALAAGVPSVVSGLLLALKKFGTLPRQKLLSYPIQIARKGYRFSSHSENAATQRWQAMNKAAQKIFGCLKSNELIPCPPGTNIIQKDLAKVLEQVSAQGEAGFYGGWVAQKITQGIQAAGGILTLDDLKQYKPQILTPLQGKYKNFEIIAMPPPSSGGALVIQLLGYAQRASELGVFQDGYGSIQSVHALAHAMSLVFADRAEFFGDPDFVHIPLGDLLAPSYLDQRWKTFSSDHANLPPSSGFTQASEPQNTTHFSVIDREGNAVAVTTTVNDNFGSGFVPPGTGIVMNNEMDDFSIHPGTPNLFGLVGGEANAIAPKKRPLSSMSPTLLRDSHGTVRLVLGAAGGPRIATSVFQSILNRTEFGMSLVDAVSAPRIHQQWRPEVLYLEQWGFPKETQNALEKRGYALEIIPGLGKVHALERLDSGRVVGVADPRGEGAAVAE